MLKERLPFLTNWQYLSCSWQSSRCTKPTEQSSYSQQPTKVSSGVARFCDALGHQSQWPPLTEMAKFIKITIIY